MLAASETQGWYRRVMGVSFKLYPRTGSSALAPSCWILPRKMSWHQGIGCYLRWFFHSLAMVSSPLVSGKMPGPDRISGKSLKEVLLSIISYCWKRALETRRGCFSFGEWQPQLFKQAMRYTVSLNVHRLFCKLTRQAKSSSG